MVIVVVAVAGCGNSADPDTWGEAEENGFTDPETGTSYGSAVEFNFMTSCLLANRSDSGGNLNAVEAQELCRCDFDGLRESLTLQEFKDLDRALRSTPNPERSRRRARGHLWTISSRASSTPDAGSMSDARADA